MKRTMLVVLMALIAGNPCLGQHRAEVNPVFQAGEVLRYKVKWQFFRLGTITVKTLRDSSGQDTPLYHIVLTVESNPDLRFIWIQEFNESLMDARRLLSVHFRAVHRNNDEITRMDAVYDSSRHVAIYAQTSNGEQRQDVRDTLRNVGPYLEGPSLFTATRCLARPGLTTELATLVNGRISSTELRFDGSPAEIEIDAVKSPVRALRYVGTARWNGGTEAGLSGEFTGWVSNDRAAVPLRAEMKVLLGSICVELESWTRTGWTPPSALSASSGGSGKGDGL